MMLDMSPINSYMFARDGSLLHANNRAAQMIQKAGEPLHVIACWQDDSQLAFHIHNLVPARY